MTQFTGEWFARPLNRKGYNRRPHFFVEGNPMSLCGNSHRGEGDLRFDPDTGLTIDNDPRLGAPQFRTPCGSCQGLMSFIPHTREGLEAIAQEDNGVAQLRHIYLHDMFGPEHRVLDPHDAAQLITVILEWQERRGMNLVQ